MMKKHSMYLMDMNALLTRKQIMTGTRQMKAKRRRINLTPGFVRNLEAHMRV